MRWLTRLAAVTALLAALYGLAAAVAFAAMCRPPGQFTRFMARVPGPAMAILPFQPLWRIARDGTLRPGDPAPDFELDTFDRSARVRLVSFRGEKPVVLVFGSYT